jgi:hypothetical protein
MGTEGAKEYAIAPMIEAVVKNFLRIASNDLIETWAANYCVSKWILALYKIFPSASFPGNVGLQGFRTFISMSGDGLSQRSVVWSARWQCVQPAVIPQLFIHSILSKKQGVPPRMKV